MAAVAANFAGPRTLEAAVSTCGGIAPVAAGAFSAGASSPPAFGCASTSSTAIAFKQACAVSLSTRQIAMFALVLISRARPPASGTEATFRTAPRLKVFGATRRRSSRRAAHEHELGVGMFDGHGGDPSFSKAPGRSRPRRVGSDFAPHEARRYNQSRTGLRAGASAAQGGARPRPI